MKILLSLHASLHVCLLMVLAPSLSLAQPRRENLSKLYKHMQMLERIARGPFSHKELQSVYHHNLTALPRINGRVKDIRTLQWNTTLEQLHSGLQSFKFHFDWLQQVRRNKSMSDPPVTHQIVHHLQSIGQLLQGQMKNLPPNPVLPELPQLTSNWDIHTSSVVVHQHLKSFCNWYLRVLYHLMRNPL